MRPRSTTSPPHDILAGSDVSIRTRSRGATASSLTAQSTSGVDLAGGEHIDADVVVVAAGAFDTPRPAAPLRTEIPGARAIPHLSSGPVLAIGARRKPLPRRWLRHSTPPADPADHRRALEHDDPARYLSGTRAATRCRGGIQSARRNSIVLSGGYSPRQHHGDRRRRCALRRSTARMPTVHAWMPLSPTSTGLPRASVDSAQAWNPSGWISGSRM